MLPKYNRHFVTPIKVFLSKFGLMATKATIRHATPTACSKLLFTGTHLPMLKPTKQTVIDVA